MKHLTVPLRPCLTCGKPSPGTYCEKHKPRRPAGSTTDRGYGADHQQQRAAAAPAVATGTVRCARGAACLESEVVNGKRVGGFIRRGQAWDVGHIDDESTGGPEHRRSNRAAGGRSRSRKRRDS